MGSEFGCPVIKPPLQIFQRSFVKNKFPKQTMRLQKKFDALKEQLVSYGSCQFPTLGFVVERYKAIESFVPENFWKIKGN